MSINEKTEIDNNLDIYKIKVVGEPGDDDKNNDSVFKSAFEYAAHRIKKGCTKKMLHKRLPILRWLPKYNKDDAVGDLVAGITVGLTVIPQSLAYSRVAGLPAQYGLYGSFLGCLIYILFGSSKDIAFGPSAIVSLLTFQTISHLNEGPDRIQHAILLCLLSGVVELLMGIFGLGFVIDFVSGPVSSGFTSAVALIIVSTQMKDILGINAKGSTFVAVWKSILAEIHNYSVYDALLGVSCIVILLTLRRIAAIKIGPNQEDCRKTKHRVLTKLIWLFGTSRNAILVIACGVIGYYFGTTNIDSPFKIIGELHSGMPDVMFPSFGYSNGTTEFTFFDMCQNLGSGLFVLPLISLMEDISVCKAFGNGQPVDATQELIALGVSNIGCSLVQSYPGTGSLSRGAVNNASGVRTPFGGFYTGILVILALLFLTPWFGYIPRACLAAIIIAAVIFMVEIKVIKPMWRTKKSDLLPGIATFIACLTLQLEIGILVGIGVNVIFILYHAARPKISLEKLKSRCGVEYLMLTPDRCLIFPSVDYVRNLVTKYGRCAGNTPVVLDCSYIYGADYTAAIVIESLTKDFAKRGQPLFFYNLKPSVYSVFEGVEPTDFVVYYTEEALDDLLKERGYIKQVKSNPSIA
ncbi:sodium-independent sulfate anion transporter-like isoform X2 [Aphidius gifuensis]|uniref:sodium-independent sulfate anion transporter-like isoform X2 n=1 Tax=Aphidius gifuensis TaxID=684658 RepID=UPI001CDCD95F|nr:sodium-independent sulfate anion transporter-like isoform X2 [Aphidius gifuensis]